VHGNPVTNLTRKAWAILIRAARIFVRIDGAQRAGAIAHYAFFSLFPLIILLVATASVFIDRDRAAMRIIGLIQTFVPMNSTKQSYILDTLAGVIKARKQAGVVAFLLLGWTAANFFATLIGATNRAWGAERNDWWRQPLKSLVFLAVVIAAAPLSLIVPMLMTMTKTWLAAADDSSSRGYAVASFVLPSLALFLSLSLFYKLAPRRHTRFADVWLAALCTTLLLLGAESLFGFYLRHFAALNLVYGALGGIMALLLWIYFFGCIFIFGACLCVARAQLSANQKGAPPVG